MEKHKDSECVYICTSTITFSANLNSPWEKHLQPAEDKSVFILS